MFGFNKTRKVFDNYIVEVTKKEVAIYTKRPAWKLTYPADTVPYALIVSLLDDTAMVEPLLLYLHTHVCSVADAKFVVRQMQSVAAMLKEKAAPVSDEEDEVALREVQVLHDQTQEAVEKHIEATEAAENARKEAEPAPKKVKKTKTRKK